MKLEASRDRLIGDNVTVAHRELHDYCYRALRTGGAHAGEAKALTEATVFATTHLNQPLDRTLSTLEAGHVPILGLPYVLKAEVSVEAVAVPDGSVIGDFGYFAATGLARGVILAALNSDGSTIPVTNWFGGLWEQPVQRLTTLRPGDDLLLQELQLAVDDKGEAFRRSGIGIHRADWHRLERLAQRYLVSERAIEAAVGDIATYRV